MEADAIYGYQGKLDHHPIRIFVGLAATIAVGVFGVVNYFYSEKLSVITAKSELKLQEQRQQAEQEIDNLKKKVGEPENANISERADKESIRLHLVEIQKLREDLEREKAAVKGERAKQISGKSSLQSSERPKDNPPISEPAIPNSLQSRNSAQSKQEHVYEVDPSSNREKLAQSYMDMYLRECSQVDPDGPDGPERQKAHSILDALEAVALRISDDNEYLDFVHSRRSTSMPISGGSGWD